LRDNEFFRQSARLISFEAVTLGLKHSEAAAVGARVDGVVEG